MSPEDHSVCEIRYRDLLNRLEDISQRMARLERDRWAIVDLLRDFQELIRLVVARLKALDQRSGVIAAPQSPLPGRSERIARHFRN
jgi:hypothetical protein